MRFRVAVVAMVLSFVSVAAAGPDQDKADALFKKGKAFLGQSKYAEACAAFEASNKLDPATGTMLNLALCFEGWGKLARAQSAYLEAEKLAALKGDTHRASAARQRADALAPKIPKILFGGLPETLPAGLTVSLDGDPIGLDALRVGVSTDPGPHTVVYGVDDKLTIEVELQESEAKELTLELPAPPVVDPDPRTRRRRDTGEPGHGATRHPGRGRRIAGVVIGGVGLVGVGVGSVVALMARSDYKDAFAAHCDAMNTCDEVGYQATHDARHRANIATVVAVTGVAAVAAGVVIFLTAPSAKAHAEHVWIRPVVTDGGAAVVLGGSL